MRESLDTFAEGKILAGCDGSVAWLVINNPERHNAIGLDMWKAAAEQLEAMRGNPSVRVLIVTGAGDKAFASGADIAKFEQERSTKEQVALYQQTSARFFSALHDFPRPTIARIRGYCIGGGLALASACDLRICEDRSRFGVPAARLGLGYGYEGVKRLYDLVGPSASKEIFFTARQFTAEEAATMGLVDRVVAPSVLDAYVEDYAARIAENAPLTIEAIKLALREAAKNPEDRDLGRVDRLVQACFDSADYVEGRRAFMEKRKPIFEGR